MVYLVNVYDSYPTILLLCTTASANFILSFATPSYFIIEERYYGRNR